MLPAKAKNQAQLDDLKKRLRSRIKPNSTPKHIQIIENVLRDESTLQNFLGIGLPIPDLVNVIIYNLMQDKLEQGGAYSSGHLEKVLNKFAIQYKKPVLKIDNETKRQRRLDRLAKLLSPGSKLTACVAVTMYNRQLIISTNSPSRNANPDIKSILKNSLLERISIIRGFLQLLENKLIEESGKHDQQPPNALSHGATIAALDCARSLTAHLDEPHKGKAIFAIKTALLKIAGYFLRGIYGEEHGFKPQEIEALRNSTPMILIPDARDGKTVHAEQEIIRQLKKIQDFATHIQENGKQDIGISMLTCLTCYEILQGEFCFFSTPRGTHGVRFPNVHALGRAGAELTLTNQRLSADDSDSEAEQEITNAVDISVQKLTIKGLGLSALTEAITEQTTAILAEVEKDVSAIPTQTAKALATSAAGALPAHAAMTGKKSKTTPKTKAIEAAPAIEHSTRKSRSY